MSLISQFSLNILYDQEKHLKALLGEPSPSNKHIYMYNKCINKYYFFALCIFFGPQSYIQQWIALNIPHTEFPAVLCDDSIIRSHILMKILSDLTSQSLASINYNSCSAFFTLKIGYFTFQTL